MDLLFRPHLRNKSPNSRSEPDLDQILMWYRILARFSLGWMLNSRSGTICWMPWAFSEARVVAQLAKSSCPQLEMCFSRAQLNCRSEETRITGAQCYSSCGLAVVESGISDTRILYQLLFPWSHKLIRNNQLAELSKSLVEMAKKVESSFFYRGVRDPA